MDYSASQRKVKRAKKHLDDLIGLFESFVKSDFYTISVEKNPDWGTNYLCIQPVASNYDFLVQCALIIGDSLHNLRSALDLLYCQTVQWCGGEPTDWTRFPVMETREQLEGFLNGALVKKQITGAVHKFIVETIKPYETGNGTIWALHRLNILDKHRLLIPTFQMMRFTNICLENEKGVVLELPMLLTEIPIRRRLNDMLADSYDMLLTVKDKGQAATGIGFQLGLPLQGQSVIMSLNGIIEEVARTIEAFNLLLG